MRKRSFATRAIAAAVLAASGVAAHALEFGFDAATSNLQLPWTPVAPISDSQFPATNYFFGGEAWMTAPIGEDASVKLSYDRDPVLRNSLSADVQFARGIASIAVGPLFGFLNSDSVPFSAGLSAAVKLQWPGVAYVSLRSEGGTAISILQANSDPQGFTELAAGFYVHNAIVSALISEKRFNELDSSGGLVTDSLTRYALTVDVFKKNVPYTALFSLGYELRSKQFATEGVTDSLGAIVLGADTTVQVTRAVKLLGGISTGAYVFGLDALTGQGPASSSFFFSANVGMSVDTAGLEAVPGTAVDKAADKTEAPPPKAAAKEPAAAADQSAAPAFSRLAIDAGAGLYYDNRITLDGQLALLGALLNTRVGAWGNIGYRLTPDLSLGGEVGIDYFVANSSGIEVNLFDIPVLAVVGYQVGKIRFEAFTGAFIDGIAASSSGLSTYVDLDAGARIRFGGIYAEASYVFGVQSKSYDLAGVGSIAASYPRFGLGYALTFM
jgi:hypothetical protein